MKWNYSTIFFLTISICSNTFLIAQNVVLEPESSNDVLGLLSSKVVENIRIISSEEEIMNIEVRCESLKDSEDKNIFSGAILDNNKNEIAAIVCDPSPLSKGAGAVDLSFRVISNVGYNTPHISSGYIKISHSKSNSDDDEDDGSLLDNLSSLFGSDTESGAITGGGDSYIFEYNKEWRLPGSDDMIINVSFTPTGKSINAKQ